MPMVSTLSGEVDLNQGGKGVVVKINVRWLSRVGLEVTSAEIKADFAPEWGGEEVKG